MSGGVWEVSRETLMSVFLSGYSSGVSTAAINRHRIASVDFGGDDDVMAFGRSVTDMMFGDAVSVDAAWRSILACLSGVSAPPVRIERAGGQ